MKKRARLLIITLGLAALGASVMAQPARKPATLPPPLNTIEAGFANLGAKPPAPAAMPGKGTPPSTLDAQMQALSRPAAAPASSIEDGFMALTRAREEKVRDQAQAAAAEAKLAVERERQEAANALRDAQERNDYLARSGAMCKAQMQKVDRCLAAATDCKAPRNTTAATDAQCESMPDRPRSTSYRPIFLGVCGPACEAAYAASDRAEAADKIAQDRWDAQYKSLKTACDQRKEQLKPVAACLAASKAACNPGNVTEASCMASRAAKPLTLAEQGITAKTVPAKAVVKNRALLTKVPDQPKSQQPVDKTMPGEIASSFGGTAGSDAEARAQAEERMKASINSGMSRPFVRSGPVVCRAMPGGIAAFSRYCEVTAYFDSGEKPVPPAKLGTPCKEQGCGIAR